MKTEVHEEVGFVVDIGEENKLQVLNGCRYLNFDYDYGWFFVKSLKDADLSDSYEGAIYALKECLNEHDVSSIDYSIYKVKREVNIEVLDEFDTRFGRIKKSQEV